MCIAFTRKIPEIVYKFHWLYCVLVVDVSTVAECYVIISSNLSSFV